MNQILLRIKLVLYATLYRAYKFSEKKTTWLTAALGFMGGVFINKFSENNFSIISFLKEKYALEGHVANIITYLASAIILFLLIGKSIKYFIKSDPELIANIYSENIDSILRDLHTGRIAWGQNITLLRSPTQRDGWKLGQINISDSGIRYTIPTEEIENYNNFKENSFSKTYHTDNENRYMLYLLPSSSSDMPTVKFNVKRVKWSEYQFVRRDISNDNFRRIQLEKILNVNVNSDSETISFINSFCLHLIIETSDEKILLTKNSTKKKGDYPGSWACSIGEQIDFEDFDKTSGDSSQVPIHWVKRALEQELGVLQKDFDSKNIHFMALNLEANNINLALVAIVTLSINAKYLEAVMDKHPKIDEEFDECKFIKFNAIHQELICPSLIPHHPSTGIRLLYASIYKYGAAETNLRLLNAKKQQSKFKRGSI